ncbi:hypothetical protein C7212DRAFT_360549 [Tuber magnatum]|uniref:Centrosomin N-terminal motif 1 domain-containing protein n=1 Tax=Tuber magnatum TaxID=42249 RepID=A0A317SCF7_9PEZI|nr:hypothetical protein C7212DRAFT_360549 [Tuber magnatum]
MSFQQHPRVSASPPSDFIAARPISQIASALLLKRLQQQKKKLAEGSKAASPISTGERTPECHSPTTNNDQMAPTRPTPPSTRSNPGRRGDANRRIEGMGAREMDQYLSKLKKENFDLKLTLYHLREKSAKTEHELAETHAQLTGALSRNAELTELNDQLHAELEARDQALGDAVRMITTYEDRVAELERCLKVGNDIQQNHVQRDEVQTEMGRRDEPGSSTVFNLEEGRDFSDEGNCVDNKSGIPEHLTVGISPFTHRPSPRLAAPFRPRAHGSGGRLVSPSPSVNSNLIDLNTPLSSSQNTSSFLRSAFACVDTHTPLRSRTVSSNMSFINRCSSTGQFPDDDFVLDSPRLSELSDSSFASMYGERDGVASEGSEDEGGMLSDNCGGSVFGGISSRIDMARGSETPNRRVSPRREIIGFKARGRENGSSAFARNALPPTPESISPRKCNGFKLIDDDEAPASRLPRSPVSSSEGKSIMTPKCSTYGTDTSDGSLTTSGVNTPSTPLPWECEEQEEEAKANCGNQKSFPHKGPSFADITNTQGRLGCRDRLSRAEGVRKSTGKVESLTLPRHVNSRIGSVRDGFCCGRQSASLRAPLPPVKTNATFTSLPSTDIHTPPWTPRTPDNKTTKRNSRTLPVIKRKDSWESIGSSLEKHDVKGKGNRGNGVPRRNTIALASNIATLPKKKVDTPNPTSAVDRRKSSIPALVRSNTTGGRGTKGAAGKPVKERGRRNLN